MILNSKDQFCNLNNSSNTSQEIALYIHWPFCKSKCPYCDFNSHVTDSIDKNQWLQAYKIQLDSFEDYLSDKIIKTIYFGGGTPSLAPIGVIEGILKHIHEGDSFNLAHDAEITLEANPTSVEVEKFKSLRLAGINRVSIGIQSLREKHLKFLGRNHSEAESLKALDAAKKYFDNTSFDLIYCLPKQSVDEWMQDLEYAISILDKHISLYQLTIEKGTKFYREYYHKRAFEMPTEEMSEIFYDQTLHLLKEQGIYRYEVSNYAKKGFESKHNLIYWNYGKYLGIGPGAHSRISGGNNQNIALVMHHSPEKWLKDILEGKDGIQSSKLITLQQEYEEKVIMGLRTVYGIPSDYLQVEKIQPLIESNHLVRKGDMVCATDLGFKVLNEIVRQLVV